uniref:Uncharacterized protein n=1 Tax=Micrurus lemniscatus lemniscatus TaxID=129467 RepID=A0A2D4I9W7_MICLE
MAKFGTCQILQHHPASSLPFLSFPKQGHPGGFEWRRKGLPLRWRFLISHLLWARRNLFIKFYVVISTSFLSHWSYHKFQKPGSIYEMKDDKCTSVNYSQNIPDIASILAFKYDSCIFFQGILQPVIPYLLSGKLAQCFWKVPRWESLVCCEILNLENLISL